MAGAPGRKGRFVSVRPRKVATSLVDNRHLKQTLFTGRQIHKNAVNLIAPPPPKRLQDGAVTRNHALWNHALSRQKLR
eukprot:scaffold23658_cov61-Phaeocystis_antarctica.AAC.1